ncbi:hypothetical protein AAFF_G00359670 [Aldrovandia affinis]|uniref:Uncharacterized protein n=1 Tax=Aldrovandia affinis TaxID=143900 RepID=A0AAD7SI60_9TELE|nr:hypothetical protein AAFF_G00359670 [Aldrovandia affinis]
MKLRVCWPSKGKPNEAALWTLSRGLLSVRILAGGSSERQLNPAADCDGRSVTEKRVREGTQAGRGTVQNPSACSGEIRKWGCWGALTTFWWVSLAPG